MRRFLLLGPLLLLPLAARAEDLSAKMQNPPPSKAAVAPAGLTLTGRWGVGFDAIPGASAGTGLVPGLANPNALALRYWINERLAWDGLVAADITSQPTGGAGGGGVPAGSDQTGWGVGTVLKLNLKRPTRWLLAQAVGRASLAQLRQSSASAGTGQTTTTFSVGAAAGFEAFLPAWDALSVEGSVGLDFSSSQVKLDGAGQAAQSGSSLKIGANGFTPVALSIHLYF